MPSCGLWDIIQTFSFIGHEVKILSELNCWGPFYSTTDDDSTTDEVGTIYQVPEVYRGNLFEHKIS